MVWTYGDGNLSDLGSVRRDSTAVGVGGIEFREGDGSVGRIRHFVAGDVVVQF